MRHRNGEPWIDPTPYLVPSAVIVGNVRIAAGARILHGAVVTAEDGEVTIESVRAGLCHARGSCALTWTRAR
jgi:carbonic anhydrase/acetyltransferase-like protein (isoleucine patch superfamily)